MSIDAVNNNGAGVNQKQENSNPGFLTNAGIGFVSSALPAYAFLKTPISAEKIKGLDADKFEKKFANVPEDKKVFVDEIRNLKENAFDKKAEQNRADKFANDTLGDAEKMSVDDYIQKCNHQNVKNKADFEKYCAELNETSSKLGKDLNRAKETLDKASEGEKSAALAEYERIGSQIIANNSKVDVATNEKLVIQSAKDGIITKKIVSDYSKAERGAIAHVKLAQYMDSLGEALPSMRSVKQAGLYGAIGAVAMGFCSSFFGGNKSQTK